MPSSEKGKIRTFPWTDVLISLWCGVCVCVFSTFIAHIWKLSGLWIQQLPSAEFWTWIMYGCGTVYWEQVICFIAYISNPFIYFPRSNLIWKIITKIGPEHKKETNVNKLMWVINCIYFSRVFLVIENQCLPFHTKILNKDLNYYFEDVPGLQPVCLSPVLDGKKRKEGGKERRGKEWNWISG